MTGILGGLIGSLGSGGVNLEFVTSRTGASSLTIPSSGVQAGDIAILSTAAYRSFGGSPTKVFDSQFTQVIDSDGGVRMVSGYRVLTSGDLGRTVTGMNENEEHIMLLVFRPSKTITSTDITIANVNGVSTSSNPPAQTLSLGSYTDSRIGVAFMSSNGVVSPRTISPAGSMTEVAGDTTDFYGHYVVYNKGQAGTETTISVDMDDEGGNAMQSWILTVS